MAETSSDGIATFEQEEGTYTVHIYKVPEGYAEDKTEYPAPETYGDVKVTLKAAEQPHATGIPFQYSEQIAEYCNRIVTFPGRPVTLAH